MKTNLKFNSVICTSREQSERLLALGLKKETADMCWTLADSDREGNKYSVEYISIGQGKYQLMHPDWYTPAWSLHRLIEMMPKIIVKDLMQWYLSITPYYNNMVSYEHCMDMESCYLYKSNYNNVYTNIIDCIEWLIKEGYFNREYLEE